MSALFEASRSTVGGKCGWRGKPSAINLRIDLNGSSWPSHPIPRGGGCRI